MFWRANSRRFPSISARAERSSALIFEVLCVRSATRPFFARLSFVSFSIFACLNSDWTRAAFASCSSSSRCRFARERRQLGFRGFQLRLRITRGLFDFRAGQFNQHRIGFDACTGTNHNRVDATFSARCDPANLFRHEQAEAAHLAHHRPALHRVDPDRRAIDARHRRLQFRKANRDRDEQEHAAADHHDALLPFLLRDAGPRHVHGIARLRESAWSHDILFLRFGSGLHRLELLRLQNPVDELRETAHALDHRHRCRQHDHARTSPLQRRNAGRFVIEVVRADTAEGGFALAVAATRKVDR